MDKKTAQALIEDTFNDSFNEDRFTIFAKNLLNDLEPKSNSYAGNLIWDDYKEHINTYKRIGKYIDPEGEALDVLIVEVKSITKLERARTVLRNFVIKHLSKFEKDYALVAFYSKEDDGADWRFSFIKLEYKSELDEEKGKVKTKKEFTPAKRYSFLVGKYEKAHTAKNQLLPLLQNIANNPTLEELEAAFSIEKVTEEFFSQYKDLYIKLYEHFENDSQVKAAIDKAEIDNTRFTKKLLGQIVFLYFLQKKGWLGVAKNERWGTGKKRFVQELNEKSQSEGVNFFKDKLQYLFYEALAKERDNVNSYYERFKCRIPFLNGGLFEADYDWQNANITIPENLFRNEEKNKSGDVGTGVLDVFDRYNFTIKEDEPLDKEVAVDPEMLGKVFENMLDITERKSKGAFYTPREIVHYMCQESLIHYLDNALNSGTSSYQEFGSDQTKIFGGSADKKGNLKIELEHTNNIRVPKKDIETYIREGHFALENDQRVATKGESKTYQYQLPESIRQHAEIIDQKLSNIRICDPAIGSGAFPVGLLHELVNAMLVLKPHFGYDYLTQKLKDFKFEQRESVNESRYIYRLKRHIIQESIYGVDIDASAIDIARLRLWLSLVVDEDDLDPIETLPNLDYKIVCGNSLIGMPETAMRNLQVEKELETLKEKFYDITDEKEKKTLRQEINTKIRELLDSAEQFAGFNIDFDYKLFFSEVWREKGGFDVVIGNPPYVRVQGIDKVSKDVFKRLYSSATGKYDLYVLFLEKGDTIQNQQGNLIFINPNKFFNADYGSGLRNYYSRNKNVKAIIDFGDTQNFSTATTYTCIIQTTNRPSDFFNYHLWNPKSSILRNLEFTSRNHFDVDKKWELLSNKKIKVFEKLKIGSKRLIDCTDEIFQGLISGGDKYFFLELINEKDNLYECKSLFDNKTYFLEKDISKKLLKGKEAKAHKKPKVKYITIYPYYSNQGKTQLLSLEEIKKYPKTFDYLNSMKKELQSRGSENMEYQTWYSMWNNREIDKFLSPKLLTQVLSGSPNFGVDKAGDYWFVGGGNAGVYGIIPSNPKLLMYFSGILNSEILAFYIAETSTKFRGGYFSFAKRFLADFPVIFNENFVKSISILSEYLYIQELNSVEFKFFYQVNCGLVYELYFPSEIKSAGKEIIKHLGDLKPITEDMSEEKKLAIIQSEFERLYDNNHPVRFAIETLDSVEEVRIIKEALK
ncbi:MAG: Eco57I restriction-modification methylase domain-containing protein [Cryomorphaceae bacterium]|nr:Eco57I restriction-modification methylase domain-containing protein [Cryomorphaceae bacterium]